jgi:regulator of cell morphogenesis and NO signaling
MTMSEGDWVNMPIRQFVQHILKRHHEYLKSELPRLRPFLDKMALKHGERDGGLTSELHAVYCGLQEELELHLHKEEMILFPFIESYEAADTAGTPPPRPPFGTVANPVQMMLQEHDGAIAALDEMRRITRDYAPADYACDNFRMVFRSLEEMDADLREHIRLENTFLFPRAIELEKKLLSVAR